MKVFGGARPQPVQQTSSWSCPLTLYEDPPLGPITLHEFESFAFDRLECRHTDVAARPTLRF